MSTEIKNTLFRFVTMRAPELLEKEIVKKTFVQYPEFDPKDNPKNPSLFLEAIKNLTAVKTKKEILISVAKNFEITSLKTREDIFMNNLVSKEFFNFAVWLTSNRTTLSIQALEIQINKIGTTILVNNDIKSNEKIGITNEKLIDLWDNLFYQIITFKSGYVREAVLSVLVADFFISNYAAVNGDLEQITKLASARVIIPKILLDKEETIVQNNTKGSVKTPTFVNTKTLDKEMNLILNKQKIELLQNSVKELSKVQTMYNKQNQKALELANKNHQKKIDTIVSKAKFIEKVIEDPITNEKTVIKEYEDIKIPKFEYVNKPELNKNFLRDKISSDTLKLVSNLTNSNNFETFDEVQNYINQEINNSTKLIFENTSLNDIVISSNGVLIPVTNTSLDTTSAFTISGIGYGFWPVMPIGFLFNTNFDGDHIVAASYTATFENNTSVTSTTFEELTTNGNLFVKIFNDGLDTSNNVNINLTGWFDLSNGSRININGNAIFTVPSFWILDGYTVNGNGTYKLEVKGNDIETGSTLEYVPSGFGIKRLGIADYRKVEQEICCYVPGEVSHIENVMASEYKERSTRMLRRSENTTTSSTEKETEKLTDSTSTDRFEMNQEVASVLAEDTHIGASVNASYSYGKQDTTGVLNLGAGADFANNTSSEQSNSQAVTHAKDVTERVLDRVVLKVKEERVSKVIEEFEENNKHGFDNRNSKDHVSGVYRWVDKIYRNQVVNYGKRLMYEFMIPEPATFHNKVILEKNKELNGEALIKPIDPRIGNNNTKLSSPKDLLQSNYQYWASMYNASIESHPENTITVGKSFDYNTSTPKQANSKSEIIRIPEKYMSNKVSAEFEPFFTGDVGWGMQARLIVGNKAIFKGSIFSGFAFWPNSYNFTNISYPVKIENEYMPGYKGEVPITVASTNAYTINGNVSIECVLTNEAKEQWQIETFNTIIQAYERKLEEYNQKLKQLNSQAQGTNPLFFRQIENIVLRKNCIEYLASHETLGAITLFTGTTGEKVVQDLHVLYDDPKLEIYASKVKFFEQAFEWGLMSYNFYPFYWANKTNWASLYNINETDDAIFRAFLQSGMARVIVTVRPGFEEAVNWYMKTGQVWNGGQVTTLDDPLFISIVDELRTTTGTVEETWESRVPTSLTVIQAGSLGLAVTQALPCDDDCKDYKLFDSDGNPVLDTNGNPKSTNPFVKSNVTLQGIAQEPIKSVPVEATPVETGTK